jgi:hypothetical protein
MKFTSIKSILLVSMVALANCTLAATTHEDRALQALKTSEVSWSAKNLGEVLGAFWKIGIIICLVLLIVDVVMRFKGSKLGISHAVRYIWFIYGTAAVWTIGSNISDGYRGYNDSIFSKLYEEIYYGYFGAGLPEIFTNPITSGGSKTSDEVLIQNALFVELIVFITIRIAALVTRGGLATGNPLSHMLSSLRRAVGMFLCFYNLTYAYLWYEYLDKVDINDDADKRSHFNVWLSWGLAIYVNIESYWCGIEIFIAAIVTKSDASQKYETTSNGGANMKAVQCSEPQQLKEIAFMHQKREMVLNSFVSRIYNTLYMLRWYFIIFQGIVWTSKPITQLYLVLGMDLIVLVVTLMTMKTFYKLSGILILVVEVITLLRHTVQQINFTDRANSRGMKQFWVDFNTHVSFWGYIVAVIIETVLLYIPYMYQTSTPTAAYNDIKLEIKSNAELENKISTYKTMKSQQGQQA